MTNDVRKSEEFAKKNKKLKELSNQLPDCCQSFLFETGSEMSIATRLAYARELGWFFDYLQGFSPVFCDTNKRNVSLDQVNQITSQDISRYITMAFDNGMQEKTVARKRAALSSFFSYLTANRMIEFNPVNAAAKVKIHSSDKVIYMNFDEQRTLLNSVQDGSLLAPRAQTLHEKYRARDIALITLLLDTGMRVSELHGISINDINLDDCSVYVIRKGGDGATLYYSDEVRSLLEDYINERTAKSGKLKPEDPLFVTTNGHRLSVRAVQLLVKKYTINALPGKGGKLSPHKMRSSFAMGFYGVTKDVLALQKKMGHKSIIATNIYAKATDEQMKDTRSIMATARSSNQNK